MPELSAAVREGKDLSEWGKRREGACFAMTEKAIRLADERGLWRKPSPSNIASLILLEGMHDQHKAGGLCTGGSSGSSAYADAYMSQLRTLLDGKLNEEVKVKLMDSGIGWTAFMRDATLAAITGRSPTFSEEDIDLLTDQPPPSLPFAIAMPDPDPRDPSNPHKLPFWTLFFSYMRIHLDEAFAVRLLSQLDLAATGAKLLESRGLAFLGHPSSCIDENKGYWGFVRVLRLTRCSLTLLLYDVVVRRIRSRVPSFGRSTLLGLNDAQDRDMITGPEDDDPYWARIERLHSEVSKRAFDGTREIVAMLEDNLMSGISLGTSLVLL
ncbi:hypothetical protein RQP46_009588 [Phenoliferia psychrophenolica]